MANKLKADRPHLRCYMYMLSDYRHTDKHLRLVRAHWLTDGQMLPSLLSPCFAKDTRLINISVGWIPSTGCLQSFD